MVVGIAQEAFTAETHCARMLELYSYSDNKVTLLHMILSEVAVTVEDVPSAPPPGLDAAPRAHLRWLIEVHIRLTEVMQRWLSFAIMEAKGFPPPARQIAGESEAATQRMFAEVLARGRDSGIFAVDDDDLTASLIKPLLQDWSVKRNKYRKRGITLERYIVGVHGFVEHALGATAVPPQPAAEGPRRALKPQLRSLDLR